MLMKMPSQTRRARSGSSEIEPRLKKLAMNLWWTWNQAAQNLFAATDPPLWRATHQSPLKTLNRLSAERREDLSNDEVFAQRLSACERELHGYLKARTWFDRSAGAARRGGKPPLVAYFCAEFALHESIPQYSGGLGVLAGDHVKSASDLGIPLVAVGMLYRSGYYTQQFNPDGSTRIIYPQIDFTDLPVVDTGKTVEVPMGRSKVRARVWKQQVGRVSMYLLDTDIPPNKPLDRQLTRHLYGGDREYRIRQEMLLGIGGTLALEAVGLRPTVYHLNEGHAAFCTLQRMRRMRAVGRSLEEAQEAVRTTTVFTTHTPVPAGNDRFEPRRAMKYLGPLAAELGLSREQMLALGREVETNRSEEFCMTVLALKLADHCNGVAELHGDTSRQMWMKVYGAGDARQVPIGHVTNGVHSQTWLAAEMQPLYEKYLKPRWVGAGPEADWWKKADRIPPEELWATRNMLRARLVRFVRERLVEQILRRGGSVEELARAHQSLDEKALTIGFARRFATYKRAPLIFRDVKRLAKILNHPERGVQLVFAGKAHPRDEGGQKYAQEIFHHAGDTRFSGRVVILEDYDMEVGRMLTSGCDVWLNNPLRPQEASGTSGMKPPLHGGINCSVLDGWWPEAFNGRNGWAINGRQFPSQTQQDKHDVEQIYRLLENQIVPMFYDRDRNGLPRRWARTMTESMKSICGTFSTSRMVAEYWTKYYHPAHTAATSTRQGRRR
jgi:glycogen phosphorylase